MKEIRITEQEFLNPEPEAGILGVISKVTESGIEYFKLSL